MDRLRYSQLIELVRKELNLEDATNIPGLPSSIKETWEKELVELRFEISNLREELGLEESHEGY